MLGEIISECWATSNRNGGRDHSGTVGDIERNQQKSFRDGAPAIAIVPNKGGWTAIASRNDRNHPRCAQRIEQVQRELREIYVLAKD
jgi:hypothetical protein